MEVIQSVVHSMSKKIYQNLDGNMQRKYNKKLIPTAKMLRKNTIEEEYMLWYGFLRKYPVRFSRQKVLGRYIVDFYCAKAKLVVELDGSQHYTEEGLRYDGERTAFLEQYGLSVIRIPNIEVKRNFKGVCYYIDCAVEKAIKNEK